MDHRKRLAKFMRAGRRALFGRDGDGLGIAAGFGHRQHPV
jgi:hypothetical protein